jgi:hypothetical protein
MICYTTFASQSPDFAMKKAATERPLNAGWRCAYPAYDFIGFLGRVRRSRHPAQQC